jgi:hypothetical protein
MDKFAGLVGRQYRLFDYYGDPEAERVIVIMGSGTETCHETVDALNNVFASVGGVLFNKDGTLLIRCPPGKTGSYTVPSSVTSIGEEAFVYCAGLSSVTIPAA